MGVLFFGLEGKDIFLRVLAARLLPKVVWTFGVFRVVYKGSQDSDWQFLHSLNPSVRTHCVPGTV